MLKNLITAYFLFGPICPAYAEDLTTLIAPKNKDAGVCGNSLDPANASTMCHPQSGEADEIYIPAKQPLLKQVVLEPDEDLYFQKIKRKRKMTKNKKAKIKRKTENETEDESDENEEQLSPPQVAPTGTTFRTFEYTVQDGDTLNTIIQQHFKEAVQPGQKIVVVAQSLETKPEQQPDQSKSVPNTIEYTVQQGDTLSSILRKYFNGNIYGKRSRLERLLELNKDIKEADTIRLGQKIIIPNPDMDGEKKSLSIAPKSEGENPDGVALHDKKLAFYFNYRFNYISVTDSATSSSYNFNTDYDLEAGVDYFFRVSSKNTVFGGIGFSEYSMARSLLSPLIVVDPTRKTQGSANLGINHELTEDNLLGLVFKYRPYFFLTDQKLEYVPAPALLLSYENRFYHENQTMLGFGLAAEAISKQDYPQFKSEVGSVFSGSFIYQQEFLAKDWVTIEFLFQQRRQGSTYYKMNDKNAGFRFTYTLNL